MFSEIGGFWSNRQRHEISRYRGIPAVLYTGLFWQCASLNVRQERLYFKIITAGGIQSDRPSVPSVLLSAGP